MEQPKWRIVTGCTQGIGRSIAEALARRHPGDGVILACRDAKRGAEVAQALTAQTGNQHVRVEQVDVSSLASVRALRDRLQASQLALCALVNNAAECPPHRCLTTEGVERQFATNVLGYHWMTRELAQLLQRTAQVTGVPSRIVNVASHWAGDLALDDVEFRRRPYDNDAAYRQSKQCNRMLTVVWAERLSPSVLVNACHPGEPCTTLSCALGYNTRASRDCTAAAQLPAFLAADPAVAAQRWTAQWFGGPQPSKCQFAGTSFAKTRQQLFDVCESYSQ